MKSAQLAEAVPNHVKDEPPQAAGVEVNTNTAAPNLYLVPTEPDTVQAAVGLDTGGTKLSPEALEEYRQRAKNLNSSTSLFLTKRLQAGDEHAMQQLLTSALPLIKVVAGRYEGGRLSYDEQVQAARIRVANDIMRFDPSQGVPLSAFIADRAHKAIIDEERRSGDLSRGDYKALRELTETRGTEGETERRQETRARLHDMTKGGFFLAPHLVDDDGMKRSVTTSLDQLLDQSSENSAEGKNNAAEPADSTDVFEEVAAHVDEGTGEAETALGKLPEREQYIVRMHLGLGGRSPLTQQELGQQLGVTESRINQIYNGALKKLGRQLAGEQAEAPKQLDQKKVLSDLYKPYEEIAQENNSNASTIRSRVEAAVKKSEVGDVYELIMQLAKEGVINLDEVPAGRTDNLTPAQRSILQNHYRVKLKDAKEKLGISSATLRTHWFNIYKATGAVSRNQAFMMALKDGLIPLEPQEDQEVGSSGQAASDDTKVLVAN